MRTMIIAKEGGLKVTASRTSAPESHDSCRTVTIIYIEMDAGTHILGCVAFKSNPYGWLGKWREYDEGNE